MTKRLQGKFLCCYFILYVSKILYLKRFNIWKSNLAYISKHNQEFQKGTHSFELGMNQYGDLVYFIRFDFFFKIFSNRT